MATVVWTRPAHEEKDRFYLNGVLQFGVTVANETAQRIQEKATVVIEDIWDTRRAPQNLVKRIKI